jgi:hypothetical protein
MRHKTTIYLMVTLMSLFILSVSMPAAGQNTPPASVSLSLEGAKMPPVSFPHSTHIDKVKLECVTCHHKDKDGKGYRSCEKCHLVKEVKEGAPIARDAFHKLCQTCHKERAAKGVSAPTKCNECHKK